MIKSFHFFIIFFILSGRVNADCSEVEDFHTSVFGILQTELLPINLESPQADLNSRVTNLDYRLLGYKSFEGTNIPKMELMKENEICKLGVRVINGISDSYESKKHLKLSEKLRNYIDSYNSLLVDYLVDKGLIKKVRNP